MLELPESPPRTPRRRPRTPTRDPDDLRDFDEVEARPFVKWAGGKRQLLPELLRYVPKQFGTYHEPFLGGGALFFALKPLRAVLSDDNRRLVRAYFGVRDAVDRVVELLATYPHNKGFFLRMRELDIDSRSDAEHAAWLIYLNKTAFNGLYRVNSKNVFNVPFGRYATPNICDEPNLRACSAALDGADIRCEDFSAVLERAKPGDFVYFDPPYVPLSASSYFTSYTADGFGMEQHIRLRDVARELKGRGVHVLLSNSSAPTVHELYADGFERIPVFAARSVSSKASGRGKIEELIIR